MYICIVNSKIKHITLLRNFIIKIKFPYSILVNQSNDNIKKEKEYTTEILQTLKFLAAVLHNLPNFMTISYLLNVFGFRTTSPNLKEPSIPCVT